jgi:leucine-rich repeat-containing G protein-coupled receptor 6
MIIEIFSNLGMNTFSKFPSKGLKNVIHIKTHNNPNLKEFPGSGRFPKVQNLVLSYAYHCCQFIPSTYENIIPDYSDFGNLKETVFFPGEGEGFDQSLWNANDSSAFWSKAGTSIIQSLF